jgi:hypothetical protein
MKYIDKFLILAFFFASNSFAQKFEIEVLNGHTREKKTFVGGANKFDIQISNVKGWNKCFAMPIKKFKIYGKNAIRGELYCTSPSGVSVGFSCVATENDLEINVQNLYSTNLKFVGDEIFVDGFAEITLSCNYL